MTRELLSRSGEVVCWSSREGSFPTAAGTASRPGEAAPELPAIDISFLAPSDDPAALGRIGPYEAVGLIGRGGMGVVFKAVDRSLNRFVAIKVLSPALAHTATARQRFAREARAMAALSHEHIVPIYAVDEHQGLPYFAMEYVPGGTLQARLLHQGPLEAVAAVRIAMQTAQALAAAHDSGLVHRDIKPANILLDRGVERVRVADFGLARTAAEAGETATGGLVGTPEYMSPEQIRGESCDGRSDLFSLGSVLYAMCTGREPFRAESIYGVLQRVVHDAPRPIRALNPTTPQWLEELTARLMAKERDERFATAAEVATLLEHELAHLQNPTIVPPPARPWRLRSEHARRRRREWLAGAAAATLAAIGGAMLLQRPPAAIEIPL